ncbi:MAG: sigma-70 family RNA polymerase sigma factor [Phycisphaerales bacterium]|jgi:RNA polymerase sigma-70 factor (ECF subfamily)|nr:sigma-70 family RNA polymerase sigma factor [Phycisphaerales bacterium]
MKRSEEQALIRRAAAGDRDAAGVFIRAYQNQLYAYLLRLSGRRELAEDIVQDAFVRVLTNLDRFDPRFRFSTWLFTIARRLFINAIQKHQPAYDSDTVSARAGRTDRPEAPVIREDSEAASRDQLQRALMSLSLEQREVILLFHQQDWPIWLIAEHLTMPEGTVKSHLHRGRRRLREAMESDQRKADLGRTDASVPRDIDDAEAEIRVGAMIRAREVTHD